MSNKTSVTFPQMAKIHEMLVQNGVDSTLLQTGLIESGFLTDLIEAASFGVLPDRKVLRQALNLHPNPTMMVEVDYDLGFDELRALTKCVFYHSGYQDLNPRNTLHITGGKKVLRMELVHLNTDIFPGNILHELANICGANYRCPTFQELAFFAARYPWVQEKFPVVGITELNLMKGHPTLSVTGHHFNRSITLHPRTDGFGARCRFLVIRTDIPVEL